MRLLHTADWHLGRIFHGQHLTEDQAYLLDQVVDIVRESGVDAVLIAGDVYDRAVPPPEAVSLLDDVLARLVLGLRVPVVVIAGNHDSPERLGFASRLLERGGLHVAGVPAPDGGPVVLEDRHGPVQIHPLPYTEPPVARQVLGLDGLDDHDSATGAFLDRLRGDRLDGSQTHPPGGRRTVVVAHAFVAGGASSESERPLSVGGAGTVDPSRFRGFTYVALGHLHRPQAAGADHVRYSGSLFKYSFDEADHEKSVTLVEVDADGKVRVEEVPLRPRRDVRRVEGYFRDLLAGRGVPPGSREDYLMVTLLDTGAVLDPIGRLREVYPNVLHVERPALWTGGRDAGQGAGAERLRLDDMDLFRAFFLDVTGEQLSEEQEAAYASVVEDLRRRQREAG